MVDENPGEELDILCQGLELLPDQTLQVQVQDDDQADVDIDGGHLHEDELKECEAGVVEDWVEPPVQVGCVTHFGSVTDDEIVFSSKYDFDHHFLPVRVEDKGDEEGDVEGGHAHPGPVVLCKNVLELDNHDGEHTSMMGRM